MGHDGSKKLRCLIGDRAHELAPGAPAAGGDAAFGCKAALDEAAGGIDEVMERVRALLQLAVEIPLVAHVIAAANVRDGISETAIDEREA